MSAAKYDLAIPKGEDFNFTLRILDSLDNPVTMNVSAPYGKAEIREESRKPLAAAFSITSVSGSGAPTDGTLKFSLTHAQTLVLDTNKKYKWDFFLYNSSNQIKLLYGDVRVESNITNLS